MLANALELCLLLPQGDPLSKSLNTAGEQLENELRWLPMLDLWIEQVVGVTALLIIGILILWATRALRKLVIVRLIRRTKNTWDDIFVDKAFFRWISFMPPTLIGAAIAERMPGLDPTFESSETIVSVLRNILTALTTVTGMLAVGALIDASHEIYSRKSGPNQRPIKGYVSLIKIFIYVLGTVAAVAFAFGKNPGWLLAGMGAMTAVLILVFKDTILSLIASITLTQNDMIRLGDWVEVPGSADGDVIDMALHTVKIQNFDRTISTVPTIQLVNRPFKNWRNMSQGPGRRIKRSIYLDASSVRFLNKSELERFGKLTCLRNYIDDKKRELQKSNKDCAASTAPLDVRRLTNIGTFRAYVLQWLKQHPKIHHGMTLLVRQGAAGPGGVPLEIYAFTRTTAWGDYEAIMADLFDFLLAAVHEFDLRLYQSPSGRDVRAVGGEGQLDVG